MKYIFLAEVDTSTDLLKDYLMDFLSRMLNLDAYSTDPEMLDLLLLEMEIFVDINEERLIIIYEDEKGTAEQTY
tara:strand:+ start:987 stop:1208 length:222 start_codon:yes stop_codon:yes gene_type:complete